MHILDYHKLEGFLFYFLEHEDIEKQYMAAGSGSFDWFNTSLIVMIISTERDAQWMWWHSTLGWEGKVLEIISILEIICEFPKANRNTPISFISLCCFLLHYLPKPSHYFKQSFSEFLLYFPLLPVCNSNDGDSWYLLSDYYMQGMELSTLYILIHLKLTTALWGQCCYYFHFPDEDVCPIFMANKWQSQVQDPRFQLLTPFSSLL